MMEVIISAAVAASAVSLCFAMFWFGLWMRNELSVAKDEARAAREKAKADATCHRVVHVYEDGMEVERCSACTTSLKPWSRYCPGCGKKIESEVRDGQAD